MTVEMSWAVYGSVWLSKAEYGQSMAEIRQGLADVWYLKAVVLVAAVLVW